MNKVYFKVALLLAIFSARVYSMEVSSSLFSAIKANDRDGVEKAIRAGADINAALDTEGDRTPLGQALYEYQNRTNDVGVMRLLLGYGADPLVYKKKEEKYESMLRRLYRPEGGLLSCFKLPVIELLLEYGVDFEKNDNDNQNSNASSAPLCLPVLDFIGLMQSSSLLKEDWKIDLFKVLLLTTDLLHAARFKKITDKLSSTEYGAAALKPNDITTIKNAVEKRKKKFKKLSKEIKQELAQKEMNYVNATFLAMGSKKNKSIVNTLTNAQLNGKMQQITGQLQYRHNTVTYKGKAYLVSKTPLQIKK